MGKMEQRKRGRAKYHNFQGCRRGQFLMMVFILSKPSSSFFFSHYVMKWGKKKISLFLHYFVPPFSFARDMVMEKARARYRERQTLVAFATCMAQERLQWFLHLICSRFRVTENGNSLMSGRISILESQDDDIPCPYAMWPCIASNVVPYICPFSNPNPAWYLSQRRNCMWWLTFTSLTTVTGQIAWSSLQITNQSNSVSETPVQITNWWCPYSCPCPSQYNKQHGDRKKKKSLNIKLALFPLSHINSWSISET